MPDQRDVFFSILDIFCMYVIIMLHRLLQLILRMRNSCHFINPEYYNKLKPTQTFSAKFFNFLFLAISRKVNIIHERVKILWNS